jgi:hypothetical protein
MGYVDGDLVGLTGAYEGEEHDLWPDIIDDSRIELFHGPAPKKWIGSDHFLEKIPFLKAQVRLGIVEKLRKRRIESERDRKKERRQRVLGMLGR